MVNKRRIVVIGGVAAGTSAASKARRVDPEAEIIILQDEQVISYGACGIPYVLEGLIPRFDMLIARSPEVFKKEHGIEILVNTKAHKIDTNNKYVHASSLSSNRNKDSTFYYDSLVIATGARAILPKIEGVDKRGVFLLRNYGDGTKLMDYSFNSKSCVIAGAGLIGVEIADSFRKRGFDVTLVEMMDQILPNLIDKEIAKIVQEELESHGIKVILNEKLERITGDLEVNGVETSNRMIEVDLVVLGTGVRPNSELAREAGIKLGYANAIQVDNRMRTSVKGIFAAGDCATALNYVTGKDTYVPLGTTANKQGRIAGENAAGGDAIFKGIAGSAITKTFDLYIGRTGLCTEEALEEGYEPVTKTIKAVTRAGYYPGRKKLWINLIADKKSSLLLGAQIIGGEGVKGRIDLISFALMLKATIHDLANYDACYVPPVSPVWEPLNIAASQVSRLI
ncbi:MAG: FAD-dependent oxidoreductase [Candidatus Eiseniibacteriota bacterium]